MAKNGSEALAWMAKEQFDLILLDINMPMMSGFEFLQELKTYCKSNDLQLPRIVMLTSSDCSTDQARAKQYQVAGYLVKPLTQVGVKQLLELVKTDTI